MAEARRIVLRSDAGADIGYGHISRVRALASVFRDTLKWDTTLAVNEAAATWIKNDNFPLYIVTDDDDEWLSHGAVGSSDAVVIDLKETKPMPALSNLRRQGKVISVIDDGSLLRLQADIAFYPPAPQVSELDWESSDTVVRVGWEWIIIKSPPQPTSKPITADINGLKILVAFGGSDPGSYSARAVNWFRNMPGVAKIDVVFGPGSSSKDSVEMIAGQFPVPVRLHHAPNGLMDLIAASDAVVCGFGVTAFEAMSQGRPPLMVSANANDSISASEVSQAGAGLLLGEADVLEDQHAITVLAQFTSDVAAQEKMATRAAGLVDGQGAVRVAREISRLVEDSRSRATRV